MRGKGASLLLIFILFFALPVKDIDWIKFMEITGSATEDLPANPTGGEINLSNDGKYRDGVVDNFDYFINRGYPSGCALTVRNMGS